MADFIYNFGAWTLAISVAWATMAAVDLIERGPRK